MATTTPKYKQYYDTYINDQSSRLNSIYDTRKTTELNELKRMKEEALLGINNRRTNANTMYQGQTDKLNQDKTVGLQKYTGLKNNASVEAQKSGSVLKELMASMGLQNSGDNLTAQMGVEMTRQNNINALNQDEMNFENDMNRQIGQLDKEKMDLLKQLDQEESLTNNQYSGREADLISKLGADQSQSLMDIYNNAPGYASQMLDLEYAPELKELQIQQLRQAIANSAKSSGGGGGGSSSKSTSSGSASSKTTEQKRYEVSSNYYDLADKSPSKAYEWVLANQKTITKECGKAFYDALYKESYNQMKKPKLGGYEPVDFL